MTMVTAISDSRDVDRPASGHVALGAASRPMNILQVSHKFMPHIGGIEMVTYEVSRRLVRMGHRVTVLTGDPTGRLPTAETIEGIDVRRLKVYPETSDVFFAPGLYAAMMQGSWDLAHVQGFHTLFPPVAMLAALRRDLPYVLTFHSGGHSSGLRRAVRGVQRAVMKPLLRRADRLIGVSKFEADHFAETVGLDRSKIVVLPNGAEISREGLDQVRRDPDHPLVLTIGRLEEYKGHHRAIRAFAEFKKVHPGARLRVLGSGPYKETLEALVAELGLSDSVRIEGVPPSERGRMAALMTEASVVLLLSDYEAHPVAALEAVSLGRPVIAQNATGFMEMVDKGYVRGVAPGTPPATICSIMLEEIASPTLKTAPEIPDWDHCAAGHARVYADVLAERAPHGAQVGTSS
jgi:glycosyltransferase involved in cell wall biosynthesis